MWRRCRTSTCSVALFCHTFLGSALSREGSGSLSMSSSHGGGWKPSRGREAAQSRGCLDALGAGWWSSKPLTILLATLGWRLNTILRPRWPIGRRLANFLQISRRVPPTAVEGKLPRLLKVALSRDPLEELAEAPSPCLVSVQTSPCALSCTAGILSKRTLCSCVFSSRTRDTNSAWPKGVPRTTTP